MNNRDDACIDACLEECKRLAKHFSAQGHSCAISKKTNGLNITKKNVARITIDATANYKSKVISYSVVVFRKSEFGGFAIDKDNGPNPPRYRWRGKRHVETVPELEEIIEYFFNLPEVAKTQSRPKDDRNSIFQNAIARAIQEKVKQSGTEHCKIVNLAKSEDEQCHAKLDHAELVIHPNFIKIFWPLLGFGQCSKKFEIEPASPGFNPDAFVDAVIGLNKSLIVVNVGARAAGVILEDLDLVSGLKEQK